MDPFQEVFLDALWGRGTSPLPAHAMAVYQNTVMQGCIDALESAFPSVSCLVGREWFRATAALYVGVSPPRDPRMMMYGSDFADFLASFEPAGDLPYLPDIARVDRLWTESFAASDWACLQAADLLALDPDALGHLILGIHPATRVLASEHPVESIWAPSRAGVAPADIVWEPQAVLLTRPHAVVIARSVHPAAAPFIESCVSGQTLADAAGRTSVLYPDCSIDTLFAELLQAGAFAPL
jgi:hypothetical protein